jgi:hypothetical protein
MTDGVYDFPETATEERILVQLRLANDFIRLVD